jgi:hypothetical protein
MARDGRRLIWIEVTEDEYQRLIALRQQLAAKSWSALMRDGLSSLACDLGFDLDFVERKQGPRGPRKVQRL